MSIEELRRSRSAARRLVVELLVVGVFAGVSATFPRGVSAGTAWTFALDHWAFVVHIGVGALVLVEAAVSVARVRRIEGVVQSAFVLLGAAGCAIAFTAGVQYVSAGQGAGWLTAMTTGWILGCVGYASSWISSARRLRAS